MSDLGSEGFRSACRLGKHRPPGAVKVRLRLCPDGELTRSIILWRLFAGRWSVPRHPTEMRMAGAMRLLGETSAAREPLSGNRLERFQLVIV